MAIDCVAVEPHLGIEAFQVALVGDDQRIDFQHLHVFADEEVIELAHQTHALLDLAAFQPQREGNAPPVIGLITGRGINRETEDFVGGLGGDRLDVHAALGRTDEGNATAAAVDQQGEVKFAVNARAVLDVNPVDHLARWPGLMGDEGATEHAFCFGFSLADRMGQTNTAGVTCVGLFEFALTAPPRVDLGLDHPQWPVQFARRGFGFLSPQNRASVRDRRTVIAQKPLGLVFMDIHLIARPFVASAISRV